MLKCLDKPNNDIEKQIIEYCLKLCDIYSFSRYQTYPKPEYPLKSKQKGIYFTMVAILISLRTTLENEQKATKAFIDNFVNIDKLIDTNVTKFADIIKYAGMPIKKAETIIKASKFIREKWHNNWNIFKNMETSKAREILKQIPGFGEKVVDCLLTLGLEKTSIAIDINVPRTTLRLFNFK